MINPIRDTSQPLVATDAATDQKPNTHAKRGSDNARDGLWDFRSERRYVAAHWHELLGCEERAEGHAVTDLVA
jgi:hypothetical protein